MNARILNRRFSLGLIIALCVIAAPVSAYVPLTVSFSDGEAVIAHWRDSAFPVTVVASEGLSPETWTLTFPPRRSPTVRSGIAGPVMR